MDKDLENNLVSGPECFICLETCSSLSPCKCNMFVHKECLSEYVFASQLTHCKICLAPYTVPRSKVRTYRCIVICIVLNAALWIFQSTTPIFPQTVVIACTVVSAMIICTNLYFIRQTASSVNSI